MELGGAQRNPPPVQQPKPAPTATVGAATFAPAMGDDEEPPDPEHPMLEQQAPQAAGGAAAEYPVLVDLEEVQACMPDPNPNPDPTPHAHIHATVHPCIVCVFVVLVAIVAHVPLGLVAMIPCIILAVPISWAVVTVTTVVMEQSS